MKNRINDIWNAISKQGADIDLMPSLRRKIIFCNRLSIIGVFISIAYLVIHLIGGWQPVDFVILSMGFAYLIVPIFNHYHWTNFARIFYVFLGTVEIALFSNIYGKEAGIQLFFFPHILVIFSIFESKEKTSLIISNVFCFVSIAVLQLLKFQIIPYKAEAPLGIELFSSISWFAALSFTLVTLYQLIIANNATAKHIASTENLNLLINAIPDPTFIKDKNEHFILANEAYKHILESTSQESIESLDEIQLVQNGDVKTLVQRKVLFKDEAGEELVAGSLMDVTYIKQAQEKIQHIEEQLKEAQENAHIGSWEHDLETGETFWSEEAIRIFELKSFSKPSFENLYTKIHPEDHQKHFQAFDKYLKKGESFQHEERVITSNGSIRHVFAAGKPLHDEQGTINKLIGSVIDITEKKEAEIALTDYKKLFNALVENSSDITSIIDIQGNIIFQSPSFYKQLGYSEKEVINESIFDFIHPEDRSSFIRFFSKILQTSEMPQTYEVRLQEVNGHWVIFESIFTNLVDDEAVGGIVINSKDITERKNAQFENTDKSQMLKGITTNMPVMIYKLDENGCFKEIIGEGLRTLGYKENQLIGKKLIDIYPQFEEEIFTAFHGEQVSFISDGVNRNKPFFFENYIFPDSTRKGGLIGFALDVTDKKLSEKRQNEYSQELERINNNLDQFAYIVSHDLKAPLRAISHLVEWIEEDITDKLSDESSRNMKMLKERVQKMQALIKGILEYAKASRLNTNFEDVNTAALVKDMVGLVGVPDRFTIKFDGDLPTLLNNKVALEQIFSNLISNAVKYHNKDTGTISIGYTESKKHHEFYVADDGPGILKEYHTRIFEMFQTLQSKERVDSTGVGLAIVKKVIEEQGGNIWVDSDHGKGAKFIFSLPKKSKTPNTVDQMIND